MSNFRELLPVPGRDDVDLAQAYAYPSALDRPWVRANMVASADGGAVGPSGRSRDLSSDPDRRVMGVLRGLCDVVVVGAATARQEGYRPVRPREVWAKLRAGRPATPRIAVVSRSLAIDEELLTTAPEDARTIVFTVADSPAERRAFVAEHADLVVVEGVSVSPGHVVDALSERGLYRVLTEGGPHLLADFVEAGLLDELCLTVSPHLLGSGSPRIVTGAPGTPGAPEHVSAKSTPVRMAHLLEAEGNLFTRYLRE
ncbi:pyrimidine reductase family protein [Nocardiopsis metallicus]|uniref:Riboflavin biosynthesis pyrimidine reductase n=1 Tax=Nocardiopsis metallicus TaxID=179819 RepID=A0A840WDM2_9ACTN|nr:pyrimidine reductase family protein [Nocardiopsis metallicus]MBB5491111.1 riboflavin biosynthesis pyrimidine reductase [Nocardiopsis metallicus]